MQGRLEPILGESSRDNPFNIGSEPEGEPRFQARPDFRESGGERADAGNNSTPSFTELRERIFSTLDASIAKSGDLLSRRRNAQSPRLFKLSPELLEMILGILAEPQLSEPPSTICVQPRDKQRERNEKFRESVKTIQSLRLVCRRICNVSSPFLLPTMIVEISAKSLAHLDMVSRHPTIGKGVKTVRVVTRCLERVIADGLQNFREDKFGYLNYILERVISNAGPADESEESRLSRELYRRYILNGSGNSIDESISDDRYTMDGSRDSNADKITRQIFWSKTYERYEYLVAEQESLTEEDVFLESVGTAVARMPRATTLHICDRDDLEQSRPHPRNYSQSKLLFDYCENEDELIDDIIKSKILRYEDIEDDDIYRADRIWSSPSGQMPLRLPGAIHKAGRSLENIYIEIELPSNYRTLASSEDYEELSAATQRLKQFTFCCTGLYDADSNGRHCKWPPARLNDWVRYLSAIVNTNALEKIDINMECLPIKPGNPDMKEPNLLVPSLGKVFTSRTWPNLRSIYLSKLPLHLSELETFIDNLKSPDTEINIQDMYLISGSWSDGLEIFKRNSIQNLVLGEPISGLECRALLSSGKLFWDGEKMQYYWVYGHSLLETKTSDY
ncbi:hypothetical protein EAE96_003290 [Botrytis aclada]|nr:hypothetical protein EAE96_003290 [Botrytis aclada]